MPLELSLQVTWNGNATLFALGIQQEWNSNQTLSYWHEIALRSGTVIKHKYRWVFIAKWNSRRSYYRQDQ